VLLPQQSSPSHREPILEERSSQNKIEDFEYHMSLRQWLQFYKCPVEGMNNVMMNPLKRQVAKFLKIFNKIDKKWFGCALGFLVSWMGLMLRFSKSFRRWTLGAAKFLTFVFSLLGILISAVLLGLKHQKFLKNNNRN
jgi:hypothetical protein